MGSGGEGAEARRAGRVRLVQNASRAIPLVVAIRIGHEFGTDSGQAKLNDQFASNCNCPLSWLIIYYCNIPDFDVILDHRF